MGGSTICLSNLIAGLSDKISTAYLLSTSKIMTLNNGYSQESKAITCRIFQLPILIYGWLEINALGNADIEIAIWGPINTLEGIRRVAITFWIIKSNKVDVVHTNNLWAKHVQHHGGKTGKRPVCLSL